MWRALPLFLLIACGNKNNNPAPTEDPKTDDGGATDGGENGGEDGTEDGGTEDGGGEDGGTEEPEKPTPESLYAECNERVELLSQQKAGECTTNEDCAATGCGSEICTTKTIVEAGFNSTCEDKLCFKILDTCGCNEGMCTWSLKAEVPELGTPGANNPGAPGTAPGPKPLPPTRLPPTKPPE